MEVSTFNSLRGNMKNFYVAWTIDRYISNKIIDLGGDVDDVTHGHPKHHMTIINSPDYPIGRVYSYDMQTRYQAKIIDIQYWNHSRGQFTVAILDCPIANTRNKILKGLGCTSEFNYCPHITLKRGGDYKERFLSLIGESVRFEDEYIQFLEM